MHIKALLCQTRCKRERNRHSLHIQDAAHDAKSFPMGQDLLDAVELCLFRSGIIRRFPMLRNPFLRDLNRIRRILLRNLPVNRIGIKPHETIDMVLLPVQFPARKRGQILLIIDVVAVPAVGLPGHIAIRFQRLGLAFIQQTEFQWHAPRLGIPFQQREKLRSLRRAAPQGKPIASPVRRFSVIVAEQYAILFRNQYLRHIAPHENMRQRRIASKINRRLDTLQKLKRRHRPIHMKLPFRNPTL